MQSYQSRCGCGRFVARDSETHVFTAYGFGDMIDPPDEQYICKDCWAQMSEQTKKFYESRLFLWRPATPCIDIEVEIKGV